MSALSFAGVSQPLLHTPISAVPAYDHCRALREDGLRLREKEQKIKSAAQGAKDVLARHSTPKKARYTHLDATGHKELTEALLVLQTLASGLPYAIGKEAAQRIQHQKAQKVACQHFNHLLSKSIPMVRNPPHYKYPHR